MDYSQCKIYMNHNIKCFSSLVEMLEKRRNIYGKNSKYRSSGKEIKSKRK